MNYKIRWSGKYTNGMRIRAVYADTMTELYEELMSDGIISNSDYDPYEKYQIEKAGYDYYDFMSNFEDDDDERQRESIKKLPALTDYDLEDMILSEDGNAYYQTFEYLYSVEINFNYIDENIKLELNLYAGNKEQATELAKRKLIEYSDEACNVKLDVEMID